MFLFKLSYLDYDLEIMFHGYLGHLSNRKNINEIVAKVTSMASITNTYKKIVYFLSFIFYRYRNYDHHFLSFTWSSVMAAEYLEII